MLAVLGLAVLPFDSSVDEPLTLFLFPLEGEQQVLGRSGAVSSGPWLCTSAQTPARHGTPVGMGMMQVQSHCLPLPSAC